MVLPKTIPWSSNQMLRSICMDTVLQYPHDDKLTISLITLASACSYGHKNKISISSRIHIGGMAPVYHSHSPHTVGQKWPTIQHNTVVSIMHRELSVTLGHTKLPVPKSLSHFLPQPLLPTINFIAYMSFDEQLCQGRNGKGPTCQGKTQYYLGLMGNCLRDPSILWFLNHNCLNPICN